MKLIFTSLTVVFLIIAVAIGTGWADVIWLEGEDFDEEKSVLVSDALAVAWEVKNSKDAFEGTYLFPGGSFGNKNGFSGVVYEVPTLRGSNKGWVFWARVIMPDTASDSFFWDIAPDANFEWGQKDANSTPILAGVKLEWTWASGGNFDFEKISGNFLRISERETNWSLDVICLRNDGLEPTDDEYEKYLKAHPGGREQAVSPRDKIASLWGLIKSPCIF